MIKVYDFALSQKPILKCVNLPERLQKTHYIFKTNVFIVFNFLIIIGYGHFLYRLNKIGKNPNLMSQKDDEISNPDESAINAVVNALAAVESKEEK